MRFEIETARDDDGDEPVLRVRLKADAESLDLQVQGGDGIWYCLAGLTSGGRLIRYREVVGEFPNLFRADPEDKRYIDVVDE